jgi:hypothetical protein
MAGGPPEGGARADDRFREREHYQKMDDLTPPGPEKGV